MFFLFEFCFSLQHLIWLFHQLEVVHQASWCHHCNLYFKVFYLLCPSISCLFLNSFNSVELYNSSISFSWARRSWKRRDDRRQMYYRLFSPGWSGWWGNWLKLDLFFSVFLSGLLLAVDSATTCFEKRKRVSKFFAPVYSPDDKLRELVVCVLNALQEEKEERELKELRNKQEMEGQSK